MRKFSFSLTLLLAVLLCAVSCNTPQPPQVDFHFETPTVEMKVNEALMLNVIGADVASLEWASSDTSVVTVYYGYITAKAIGRAEITAVYENTQRTCQVLVSGANNATLRIVPVMVTLKKGETQQFKSYNTYGLDETWTSSDPSVATVDNTGLVTALAAGNTTITLATAVEQVTALVAVEHNYGEYQLVWSDEFNGTALDRSVWDFNTGGGGWGNNELQYYTDRQENVRVEDGYLKIHARKENYDNREYTSGRILTKNKKTFTYGKFEARIKFPGGGGTWPAFWMMGNEGSWPACGEIDIQEHVGNIPTRASFAVHTPEKNGTKGNNWAKTAWFDYDLSDDFHIYGCEWAKEEKDGKDVIRFFVDGVQYAEVWESTIDDPKAWPFNKPHFFIFNLAIGGNMGGKVSPQLFDTERIMYVDWLRVYQRNEQ